MPRRGIVWGVALVACVLLVVAASGFGGLRHRAVIAVLGALTGERMDYDGLRVGPGETVVTGLRVGRAGTPLATVVRAAVRYRLGDLGPGSAHRFGLRSVELDGPVVTLRREPGGGFADLPSFSFGGGGMGAGSGTPLAFDLVVRGGTVRFSDPARTLAGSRRFALERVAGTARIVSGVRSRYAFGADFGGDPAERVTLAGTVDVARGYAQHRVHATRLPVAPIADYFIDDATAEADAGTATDLDVRLYGFADRARGLAYHVAGGTRVDGATLRIPGLRVPVRGLSGRLDVYDGGIASRELDGRLGAQPVRAAGGLYGWGAPSFRLGIVTGGPLGEVRHLFAFSNALPVGGGASAIGALLEGPAALPLVAARIAAAGARYATFPLRGFGGRVVFHDEDLAMLGVHADYGGLAVTANGDLLIDPGTKPSVLRLVTTASGPARLVPYAAQTVPGALLAGTGLLAGEVGRPDARGVVTGAGAGATFAGLFHVDPRGDGTFGPLAVRRGAQRLDGTFFSARSSGTSGFWLAATGFDVVRYPRPPRLPGLDLEAPAFAGTVDGALAGYGPPSRFGVAARVRVRGLRVGGVTVADVTANVAGPFADLRLGDVHATARFGRFDGVGALAGPRIALRGAYAGDFTRLRAFTGDLGALGPVAGPVALLIDGDRTVVQSERASTAGSRVNGVPVDAVAGTLAVAGGSRLRILAARAEVAGGTLVAAGSPSRRTRMGVSLADASAGRLRRLTPLDRGRIVAIGGVGYAARGLAFDGGLDLARGSIARAAVDGGGDVSLRGDELAISDGEGRVASGRGRFAGRIDGFGTRRAAYDVGVRLDATPLGPLARLAAPEALGVAGTLEGTLRARGRVGALAVAGELAIPEGELGGLAFRGASARIALDPGGASVAGGAIDVGSTHATFSASARGASLAASVAAARLDLSDFDDLFDAGDTLAGRGRLRLDLRRTRTTLATDADVAIGGLRYRRFGLGDASARWTTRGRTVAGAVAFGGVSGRLAAAGTLRLPPDARAPLGLARFAGTATLRDLDLGTWLPALGYQLPVLGRVDADATVAGPLGDPAVRTTATLRDGSLGRFPVDALTLAARSTRARTTLERVDARLSSLTATGSGSFGPGDRDPVALAVHLKSGNVGDVVERATGFASGLSGTGEADLHVTGTRASPQIAGGFDLESATLRGIAVPRALGEFGLRGRDLALRDVEVGFASGAIYLAGSLPIEISPFGFGPSAAQLSLDASARGISLADFAPLLPPGSSLAGTLDGSVHVSGTAGAPQLSGGVTLAGGRLLTPAETIPFERIAGRATFAGESAQLDSLRASAGGGTIEMTGSVSLADLARPDAGPPFYDFRVAADALRLNLPAYGGGRVDGRLRLRHAAGGPPLISGAVAASEATIPFASLLAASGAATADGSAGAPEADAPALALARPSAPGGPRLDVALTAGKNVRVRSANVDIGLAGTVRARGTQDAPALSGGFVSTGGTIAYLNSVFRLVDGRVSFEPDLGLVPTLSARATAHVIDPDPNTVRNAAGSADVRLDVAGPANALTIGLSSDPAYDRAQILGLLLDAPALGASDLFGEQRGSAVLNGSTSTAGQPGALASSRNQSGEISVTQEAFGIANAQFTRTLLAPFETTIASAVGLTSLNVDVDYTGTVDLVARKRLGGQLDAIYGTTLGFPYRQSVGFELKPSAVTSAQATVFQTFGPLGFNSLTPSTYASGATRTLTIAQPSGGTFGFSLSLQRLFR